jgi:hypothetical protein
VGTGRSRDLRALLPYQDSRNEGTGNGQRSIDLIDGAAAECYVTSKELRYRRCGGFEVTVRHARSASGHNIMGSIEKGAFGASLTRESPIYSGSDTN